MGRNFGRVHEDAFPPPQVAGEKRWRFRFNVFIPKCTMADPNTWPALKKEPSTPSTT
jgi:hypothetical protein